MAELLVIGENRDAAKDPEKNQRGGWRRGMVVEIRPDGFFEKNGPFKEIKPPRFFIVKVPGVPEEKFQDYMEPNLLDDADSDSKVSRRLWQFDFDSMPEAARAKVDAGELVIKAIDAHEGKSDIRWDEARAFVKNAQTGEVETKDLDEAK